MFTHCRFCELHPHVCNIIYLPLSLPAMYKSPTMSPIPENCIKQNTDVTIFCNSTGGHQKGLFQWFYQFGTNCKGSAELLAKKTDDKPFSLSSKLTVLKATYSGSTNYSCTVHNTNGVQERKASFEIPFVCSAGTFCHRGLYTWMMFVMSSFLKAGQNPKPASLPYSLILILIIVNNSASI